LTVIKGYVYTLQRSDPDPAQAAKLEVINSECERLAYLVEDLLELSRAQAGELRISALLFPLRPCVEEVTQRLRMLAVQHEVELELDWQASDELVMGDENRIRQILANLITNGSRTGSKGSPRIEELSLEPLATELHGYILNAAP
jgi:signal transduction histidine kinase